MKSLRTPTAQLVIGLVIAAAAVAAFASTRESRTALVGGGLIVAFVLAVHFGRRHSDTLEVLSGIGDERTRHLYTEPCPRAPGGCP